MGLDPDLPTKCVVCGRRPEIRCLQCDEVYCMWMGKPRCFRKHHTKGKRRDHDHVPYTLLETIDDRVKAEERAEVEREVARQNERAAAAAEFLRLCDEKKAAERAHENRIDDAAEDLLKEQLKLETDFKRGASLRWLWDSLTAWMPRRLRRSLSPKAVDPRENKLTAGQLRHRKGDDGLPVAFRARDAADNERPGGGTIRKVEVKKADPAAAPRRLPAALRRPW